MNLDHELDVAVSLALKAGAVLRKYQERTVTPSFKDHGEVVTAADIEADMIIRRGLQENFSRDAVYSEESRDNPKRLHNERVWIVDPLDSTSNFLAHGDEYTVSIGLAMGQQAALGVVYNPRRNVLYAGYVGGAVKFNNMAVQTTDSDDLATAQVAVSRKELRKGEAAFAKLACARPLSSMAYKLARVAAGMDDGVVSLKPRKEWGTCAGIALVKAAGGRATLLDGGEVYFNRRELKQPCGMVAAGTALHQVLLREFGYGRADTVEGTCS